MKINFTKYEGNGNDFIIIDDRKEDFSEDNVLMISKLCDRKFGIGADGLILLRKHKAYDFQMIYFNSDGNESSMCGNGGRCLVSYALQLDINLKTNSFLAIDGVHKFKVVDNEIYLKMNDVKDIVVKNGYNFLDTGSPHVVQIVENVDKINVYEQGKKIRNQFEEMNGVNVNFVSFNNDIIKCRTFERGVENETLSCGTGVVAVALYVFKKKKISDDKIIVSTNGGSLSISFKNDGNSFHEIWLKGNINKIFDGLIEF
ncbi:diaminopimelate epimerase [Bacteroidota bacterium]|nr:diaminopimelate epimerase [Bacteroidota bacterium]